MKRERKEAVKQRSGSLQVKLTIILAAILICNAVFVGIAYYRYAYQDIMKNYSEITEVILDKMVSYFDEHLSGISSRVDALNSNLSYQNELKQLVLSSSDTERARQMSVMADFISQLEVSDAMIDSCYLYTEYGSFKSFTRLEVEEFDFTKSPMYMYFEARPTARTGFFGQMEDYVFKTEYPVVPVVFKRTVADISVIYCFALNTQEIERYLEENCELFDGVYIQSNGQLVVEVNNDMDVRPQLAATVYQNQNKYLITTKKIPGVGWKISTFISRQEIMEHLDDIRWLITGQIAMAMAVVMALGRLLTCRITWPIRDLSEMMRHAPENNFSSRFYYFQTDEIGSLAGSFNRMSDEINRLMDTLNEKIEELEQEKKNLRSEQEAKRSAEIKALQAQINPHFLYNTLNTISWQAAGQGAMQACQTANLLGKFFRISLNQGQEYGTIGQEIEQIASYLEIQRVRYKAKLNFCMDVAEEIKEYETVHLVLQPLVENAIYHGIKEVSHKGMIKVQGYRTEENIVLIVEDNGQGIPKQKLDRINGQLSFGRQGSSEGYGIFNVNERIRLSYGPQYGLCLESEEGRWTRSILTLPARQYRYKKEDDIS